MSHTDRLYLIIPLVLLLGLFLVTVGVYGALCASGHPPDSRGAKHNEVFGPFWGRYVVWVLSPVERLLAGRVSPNAVTAASLVACLGAGLAVALGHLITGLWLYMSAGLLDIMDGRLARQMNRQTKSGALFDSVSDRWGELVVMGGFTWYLRDTPWMLAAMLAASASVMVSYTRARGEGLGLDLHGGWMQRAERVSLVCIGMLAASWSAAAPSTQYLVIPLIGGTLALCGLASFATAIGRWIAAFKALAAQDAKKLAEVPTPISVAVAKPVRLPAAVSSPSASFAPVPKALRESAEMGV